MLAAFIAGLLYSLFAKWVGVDFFSFQWWVGLLLFVAWGLAHHYTALYDRGWLNKIIAVSERKHD